MNKFYFLLIMSFYLTTNSFAAVIANTKVSEKQASDIRKLQKDENFFKSGVDSIKIKYLTENYPDISQIGLDKFPLLFEILLPQDEMVLEYYQPNKEFFRKVAEDFYEANIDAVDIWSKELGVPKTELMRENFIGYYELLISNYYLMYKSIKVPDSMVSTSPESINDWLFKKFDRNTFVDYFYFLILNSDSKLF